MKVFMQLGLVMAGPIAAATMLLAADVPTTYTYGNLLHVPSNYSGSYLVAASSSNAVMIALNAQTSLLKEILQEHQSRAAELTQKDQSEKAKWETELVNELQEKIGRLQKSIDQRSHPAPAANGPNAGGGEGDEQVVFMATVDSHLEQIRQELSAALADTQVLGLRIATNKMPEEIAAISLSLGDNQRIVRELQKEQLDLELRKLEFRAIRKAMQR